MGEDREDRIILGWFVDIRQRTFQNTVTAVYYMSLSPAATPLIRSPIWGEDVPKPDDHCRHPTLHPRGRNPTTQENSIEKHGFVSVSILGTKLI